VGARASVTSSRSGVCSSAAGAGSGTTPRMRSAVTAAESGRTTAAASAKGAHGASSRRTPPATTPASPPASSASSSAPIARARRSPSKVSGTSARCAVVIEFSPT
jgi:hypothetical protein